MLATLLQDTDVKAFGAPVELGAAGLRVVLDVPPGVELERAELVVEAPGDAEEVELQPAISTSAGRLTAAQTVEWIAVDWGSRRPLTYLRIDSGDSPSAAGKGRLKVAEGGPWFPPLPFEFVPFNQGVRLAGVTATRLLIEPVNATGEKLSASFRAITIKVAARPPDLMASLTGDAPFFRHPILLGAGEVLVLRDELTSALGRAWPADLAGGKLTVSLRSSAAAKLQSVRLALATCTLTRAWDGGAESLTLPVAPGDYATALIPTPDPGPLRSLAFTVSASPRPETVPLRPAPCSDPLIGHLIGTGFRAAQAFSTPAKNATLVGMDLYIQPLTPSITGTLAICPDAFGRPADAPFAKALAELTIKEEGAPPWAARWVNLDLPVPVPVQDTVFWAVFDLPQGEAVWLLGDTPAANPQTETALRGAQFQAGGDRVWREREPPWYPTVVPRPSAYARPRFRATASAPAPVVTVRWGDAGATELAAPIGEGGRVSLDASALAALSRPTRGDTRIHVSVRSAVGSVVTLSALEMRVPWRGEFP